MNKKSKHYWYNSIKSKLMITMIIIAIIPLLFLGSYNIKLVRLEVEKSIHKEHSMAVTRISQGVRELVNTLNVSLENIGLTNLEIFQGQDPNRVEDILYKILSGFPYLEEVSIIEGDGSEIWKISKRHVISHRDVYSLIDKKHLNELNEGKMYIGRPRIDGENQMIFDLIVPVIVGSNDFVGGIKVKVSLRHVMEEITAMDVLQGSYIILIDEEGSLIGHSDYSQVLRKQDVGASRGVEILIGSKKEQGKDSECLHCNVLPYRSYTGEEVLGVYGKIPIVGWGVVVEQPLVDAYGDIQIMIYRLNIILFTILILIFIIGTGLILKLIKPVEELEKGVEAVKRGDLDYQIPRQGNDEIGLVVEAFNNMTREIKRTRENESLIMLGEKRAAIGTLAAGVAHEINNPMNNLGFYATDLIDRIKEEDIRKLYEEGVLEEYLEIIKEQIERCSDITQNLLSFSRESEIHIRPIDICRIIRDVLKLMEHRLRTQNISVDLDFQELEMFILGDESQIQQVVLNIITNAVDEMKNKGDLKIIVEEKDIKGEEFLIFRVIDSGGGIGEEDLGRIFDPFYTTKPLGEGTGLGLSISLSIVERMRGSIDIVTKAGYGTELILKFPKIKEVI